MSANIYRRGERRGEILVNKEVKLTQEKHYRRKGN